MIYEYSMSSKFELESLIDVFVTLHYTFIFMFSNRTYEL